MPPETRLQLRSLDKFLLRAGPVLAVVGVVLGIGGVLTGEPVRYVVSQFVLALVMVCTTLTARARLRRNELPDERG
ncbi:hypothetical protein SAMN05421870_103110 [Streptomyces qinglanensis]|uniref:Uncharacterized protein n=2 Tax=Streptomyces qinglanensis TaxID=943816 RepID=A0A1H9QTZ6_9ACTN|nr:hypothetical protein SAMN05421870_103110 [Streptomyces qinglanensis]